MSCSGALLSATESDETDAADVAGSAVWSDVVGPQLQRAIGGVDANGAVARLDVNVPDLDPMLLDIERQLTSGSLAVSSLDDVQGTLGWPRIGDL